MAIIERSEARELDDLTLARAQQGEAPAFQALVETYQGHVFALLWRFFGAGHREVVEDVAQDSFLGVYRSLARFRRDGEARLSTWILTIAMRTALKQRRKRSPDAVPVDDLADVLASGHATEQPAKDRAFVEALGRALAALSEPHRAVFLLRAYHGLEYQEIADALDIDLGTVKSRLSRARRQLQDDLKEFAP